MKIKTYLKNIVSVCLSVIIAATTFGFDTDKAQAWEQGANGSHEEINKTAVSRFLNAAASSPKFTNSPIDRSRQFIGNETTSATLATSGFSIKKSSLTFSQWVTHGGFSADEPEIWACVRHFYDPLAVNGVPQLTDHLVLHGLVYSTISAKEWAFKAAENPYSWHNALVYYKKAMEIPDDAEITTVKGLDFRDPDIPVSSAAEARSAYLGKAYRALGETMHMMADITQPAHVRNDSHPAINPDPLESTVNKDTIRLVRDSPVVPSVSNAIDSAANLEDLYEKVAIFTNSSFYTSDTIYDQASGVHPSNWENPYPRPQFDEMTVEEGTLTTTYFKEFNGKKVPMAYQTYSSSIVSGVAKDYIVPPTFAIAQAEVLIPIAIKANTKVINSFFPTLDLSIDVKNGLPNGDPNYKEFSVGSQLKHKTDTDIEWKNNGLTIQYTGPAELWVETAGTPRSLGKLNFKEGTLEKPVAVFVGDKKYAKKDLYQVKDKDSIYVVVDAGGRNIKSNKYAVSAQTDLSISPTEITLAPGGRHTFIVKLSGPGSPQSTYSIDEGAMGGDINSAFGIYTAPYKEGIYHVTATLNSDRSKKATAVITVANVTVTVNPPTATVSPNSTQTFAAEVIGNTEKRVTWKVEEIEGGTITADGVYTAPAKGGPYHIVATSKADSRMTAKATVTIQTPTAPAVNIIISPVEVVLVPGSKQEFRVSVTGVADPQVVWWGIPGPNIPMQSANIPVIFTASSLGDYTVIVGCSAEPRKTVEAKVKVVPGVWYFVNKTEETRPNIGLGMPSPSGGVTFGNGSAKATNTTNALTSNWTFTWTIPPTSLPVGQKFNGSASVKDAGSSFNKSSAEFPEGGMGVYMQLENRSVGDCVMFGAGREMQIIGYPFTSSKSKDFSLTVPAGKIGGPQLIVRVGVEAEANFGDGVTWTQQCGEVLYKYELRPNP